MEAVFNVGEGYRATPADTTPALLPDIHPWWTDLPPLILLNLQTFGMCPSLSVWQDALACGGGNYFQNTLGLNHYNQMLYQSPLAQDLNPPGARMGAFPSGGPQYVWLDGYMEPFSFSVSTAPFDNWSTPTLTVSDFDVWCQGGTGAVRSVALPSTIVIAVDEAAALRFTLEWQDADVPWQLPPGASRQKNLQSFTVVIR
jgi:hypothetical protein